MNRHSNGVIAGVLVLRLALGIVIWLGCGSLVYADTPIELGLDAYRNGDHKQAESHWLNAAGQGSHAAEFYLSVLYGEGHDDKDRQRSIEWLNKSANNGFAPAQFNLGNHLFQGRWIPQDLDRARYWWQLASEQGWEGAQYNLGLVYLKGIGVEENREQAEYWLGKASASGSDEALKLLNLLKRTATETEAIVDHAEVDAKAQEENAEVEPTGQRWVNEQNGAHLTIQLLALQNLNACRSEVERIQQVFQIRTEIYRYHVDSQYYCALLLGSYAEKRLAHQAVSSLPDSLKAGKPWVRRFATLKKLAQ